MAGNSGLTAPQNVLGRLAVPDDTDGDDASADVASVADVPNVTNVQNAAPMSSMVDRVKEPTFQFGLSADMGGGDKEDHDAEMAEERQDIGVKRVGAVLHLMAGDYGAARMMDIGRRAAREIEQWGQAGRLDSEIEDPVMRYAVLELIKGSYLKEGDARATKIVDEKLGTLYQQEGRRIRASFNIAESAFAFSADPKSQGEFRRLYFDAIDLNAPMTARFLFNGLTSLVDIRDIDHAIAAMSVALRDDMLAARTSVPRDHLSRMLSYLDLFGTARVGQSMVAFARDLLVWCGAGAMAQPKKGNRHDEKGRGGEKDGEQQKKEGEQQRKEGEQQRKETGRERELLLTKELFNLGGTTVPGPLLDKLAESVVGKEKDRRARFFTGVYRQSSQWPMQVWASDDVRTAVQLQLRRRMDQLFVPAVANLRLAFILRNR